ncbi:MAG: hypothetical protein Kow0069_23380 [Promethearchaeota archaeon]
MALKQEGIEVLTQYGLAEEEIRVYLKYLGLPYATASQVQLALGEDTALEHVQAVTDKLVELKFLKKVVGKVDRYVPLEPYFSLFTKQSRTFREQISATKDEILADQSRRFEKLDGIERGAVGEVESAVSTQVDAFLRDSDEHDAKKKAVIEKADSRFRDTAKQLEGDLHSLLEGAFSEFKADVDAVDGETAGTWDGHSRKFTSDNDELNAALDQITGSHVSQTEALERNLHGIVDQMQAEIQKISAGFVESFEAGVTEGKTRLEKIIDELLADFGTRVSTLETELKKDLDAHVDSHRENATALQPKLTEILEKYLARMNAVVEDLKKRFSKLLFEHQDHVRSTTTSLAAKLKERVSKRHEQLAEQVRAFEEKTVMLIDNLKEISDKMTDLASTLSSRGSAWKALFISRHKEWVELWREIDERVNRLSGDMKADFTSSTSGYIRETGETTASMHEEIDASCQEEDALLKQQSDALDAKAQETLDAELEGLAAELTTEIDETMKGNIKHCADTTLKLKDSLEKSLHTHHDDYEAAFGSHRRASLEHFTECDADTKKKNAQFLEELDRVFKKGKADVTAERETQVRDATKHLEDTKATVVEHSRTFAKDVEELKAKQRKAYDERLAKVRGDFDAAKAVVTEKIDGEVTTFHLECTEMDEQIHAMLEDHKAKYKNNAETLQGSLTQTVRDNTQNNKDAIADFTLSFMNSIDEAHENAETNEERLTAIQEAAEAVIDASKVTTWHVVGSEALVNYIGDMMARVKSSIIVVTPTVVPKILELLSQHAYNKRAARFFYTTNFDLGTYGPILQKMKALGNIQFRQLKSSGDFWACTRDAEEVILAPATEKEEELIAVISEQPGYAQLYSQFIGPIFQANSRPIQDL